MIIASTSQSPLKPMCLSGVTKFESTFAEVFLKQDAAVADNIKGAEKSTGICSARCNSST